MDYTNIKIFTWDFVDKKFVLNENISNKDFINYCCDFIIQINNSFHDDYHEKIFSRDLTDLFYDFTVDSRIEDGGNSKYTNDIYKLIPIKAITFILFFKSFMDLVKYSGTQMNNYIIEKFGDLDMFYNELNECVQKEIYNFI